jgi:2-polyprenyl-3-methyl-5-hydroxy-6-metoxy-1,4-benzoquinol methylase
MKNIYQKIYSDQKNLGDLAKSPRVKIMLDIINGLNLQEKKILDIGCYDGTLLSQIRNRNNKFFGIEASEWAVQKAREKEIDVQEIFFDDLSQMPYADNFFDLVAAGEIIEHIFDTDFFLEEIGRILKPGGKLLISTPNIASLGRRLMLLAGRNPIIELSPNEPESSGHIRYFILKSIKKLLAKHNFQTVLSKSDYLNFSKDGKIKSEILAKILPRLGTSVIILAKNGKER